MRAKSIAICCLVLFTACVVFSIGRIEYLNAEGGHVLPRHTVEGQTRAWEIHDLSQVREQLDDRFLERREHAARIDAFEKGESEPAVAVSGAPYSVSEQRAIDKLNYQHDALTKLHWNIRYFGWAQYFIAPGVLVLAIVCGLAFDGWGTKVIALLCGSLSCVGMFVILVREYWQALGG